MFRYFTIYNIGISKYRLFYIRSFQIFTPHPSSWYFALLTISSILLWHKFISWLYLLHFNFIFQLP